jgi:hypothetical protein
VFSVFELLGNVKGAQVRPSPLNLHVLLLGFQSGCLPRSHSPRHEFFDIAANEPHR